MNQHSNMSNNLRQDKFTKKKKYKSGQTSRKNDMRYLLRAVLQKIVGASGIGLRAHLQATVLHVVIIKVALIYSTQIATTNKATAQIKGQNMKYRKN